MSDALDALYIKDTKECICALADIISTFKENQEKCDKYMSSIIYRVETIANMQKKHEARTKVLQQPISRGIVYVNIMLNEILQEYKNADVIADIKSARAYTDASKLRYVVCEILELLVHQENKPKVQVSCYTVGACAKILLQSETCAADICQSSEILTAEKIAIALGWALSVEKLTNGICIDITTYHICG